MATPTSHPSPHPEAWMLRSPVRRARTPGQGHQGGSWEGIRVVTSFNSVTYFSRSKMSPPQDSRGLAAVLRLLGYLRRLARSPEKGLLDGTQIGRSKWF